MVSQCHPGKRLVVFPYRDLRRLTKCLSPVTRGLRMAHSNSLPMPPRTNIFSKELRQMSLSPPSCKTLTSTVRRDWEQRLLAHSHPLAPMSALICPRRNQIIQVESTHRKIPHLCRVNISLKGWARSFHPLPRCLLLLYKRLCKQTSAVCRNTSRRWPLNSSDCTRCRCRAKVVL